MLIQPETTNMGLGDRTEKAIETTKVIMNRNRVLENNVLEAIHEIYDNKPVKPIVL